MRGVVEPDEEEDREVLTESRGDKLYIRERRVPHHQFLPRRLVGYYYNLACYYRSRGDFYNAGRALGRAAHYLQDWALDTRNDPEIHDRSERGMDFLVGRLPELCERVKPMRSSDPAEALCKGFFETVQLLKDFLGEPPIDPETARREFKKARATKWSFVVLLVGVAAFAIYLQWAVIGGVALTVAAVLTTWTPKSYIRAMKAGVVKLRPPGYKTPM